MAVKIAPATNNQAVAGRAEGNRSQLIAAHDARKAPLPAAETNVSTNAEGAQDTKTAMRSVTAAFVLNPLTANPPLVASSVAAVA